MSTTFKQVTSSTIGMFSGIYEWTTLANWSNGIPGNNADVVVNSPSMSNPASYDNIASLTLNSLNVQSGFLAVAGTLTIGSLSLNGGGLFRGIYADTLLSGGTASVLIDALTGAGGFIQAVGTGAVTKIIGASDPGENYGTQDGGEIVLAATPNVASTFYFAQSTQPGDTGTIGFGHPGSTISSMLGDLGVGSAIELPGTLVLAVNFGANNLTITTDGGTTVFSNVSYQSGALQPGGYVAAFDAATGLEKITFTEGPYTYFSQVTSSPIGPYTFYTWSTAANWSNGLPHTGGNVIMNISQAQNPGSLDDIAGLSLDTLNVQSGELAVTKSLTIGNLSFVGSGAFKTIYTYTLVTGGTAALTVNGVTGSGGAIQAVGTGALTTVLAATDPGENYGTEEGGMLVLTATPNATSTFYLSQTGLAGDTGTIAFKNPGKTIVALLAEIGVGSSIELPGSEVSAVTFSRSALSVTTNLGKTSFTNVAYLTGSLAAGGYVAALDPTTGLEKITFTAAQSTTFKQIATTIVDGFSVYAWSNASNWTNGIPGAGATAVINSPSNSNPASYDDVAGLYLAKVTIDSGELAVARSLTVGTLAFSGSGIFRGAYSDTLLSGGIASLTIDAIAGAHGYIQAVGAGAITTVLATSDPGENYGAEDGGMLIVTATPKSSSTFYLSQSNLAVDTGTIAFKKPGAVVSAVLGGVGVGSAIELPGSLVSSVVFGVSSLSITTNLGTTNFSNVSYQPGALQPGGYTAAFDSATGLEKITFADPVGGGSVSPGLDRAMALLVQYLGSGFSLPTGFAGFALSGHGGMGLESAHALIAAAH